ncbi:hypothetical protein [Hugenholtzia roseola]|uniref:hypothetical protein n=1 Tax=Hugenholtzia roseola TaxID=1002 RepID=UPI0012B5EC38|nr:hypothetical protein [Hugenholtzia roseola]
MSFNLTHFALRSVKCLSFLLLLGACQMQESVEKTQLAGSSFETGVFSSSFFTDSLQNILSQQTPKVEKRILQFHQNAAAPIKEEQKILTFSDKDWQKELLFFKETDISAPQRRDKYSIAHFNDSLVYLAKDEKLAIRRLCLQRAKAGGWKKITVEKREQNSLYAIEQTLSLEFEEQQLKRYHIIGKENALGNETLFYEIQGQILKP